MNLFWHYVLTIIVLGWNATYSIAFGIPIMQNVLDIEHSNLPMAIWVYTFIGISLIFLMTWGFGIYLLVQHHKGKW